MNRRSFISSAASIAGLFGAKGLHATARSIAPRARFGVLSDVHITTDPGSCDLFEHALRTFDKRKCDGVLLCGDIADYGLSDELKAAGDTWFKVFPGGKRSDGEPIEPLFIYGDHDMGGYMHKRVPAKNIPEKCIPLTDPAAAWEAAFREKWSPVQVKKVKGYTFILAHHPQHDKESEFGQKIPGVEAALAAHAPKGNRPFFFIRMVTLINTMHTAIISREIRNKRIIFLTLPCEAFEYFSHLKCKDTNKRAKCKACIDIFQQVKEMNFNCNLPFCMYNLIE